jgi:hypothetical protein
MAQWCPNQVWYCYLMTCHSWEAFLIELWPHCTPVMRTLANRTEIAKNLMRAAAFGERDPIELELAASKNLVVTAPKEDAALAQVMRRAREWRGYPYQQAWVG